ncbi:hypothetical protein FRIGORI9N_60004 [Frigoribacterium sp. 9N]|nr:hypothetical protein FRIGORI9N_60004 [Frigoribacterium sp. 9N]
MKLRALDHNIAVMPHVNGEGQSGTPVRNHPHLQVELSDGSVDRHPAVSADECLDPAWQALWGGLVDGHPQLPSFEQTECPADTGYVPLEL